MQLASLLMVLSMSVHNTVSRYRKNLQLTQEELAQLIGVSRQTIISIEKGNYTPSVELALKLSIALKTTVEKLFTLFPRTKQYA